ncbi:MAG TPA: Maf family protein [Thermoclostridium sp.]|nr:Maf family protein [Thermoclostridium sp.]
MKQLILASQSPRRKVLLNQIGVEFETYPSNIEEIVPDNTEPEDCVGLISQRKANSVKEQLCINHRGSFVILAADTIVVFNRRILEKPIDGNDAFNMLQMLSGKWHEVITGVTIIDSESGERLTHVEKTRVKVGKLTSKTISNYIKTGEPFDKAGAYGIQGIGALLVEKIEGCFYNVVGLPLYSVSAMLSQFGIKTILEKGKDISFGDAKNCNVQKGKK